MARRRSCARARRTHAEGSGTCRRRCDGAGRRAAFLAAECAHEVQTARVSIGAIFGEGFRQGCVEVGEARSAMRLSAATSAAASGAAFSASRSGPPAHALSPTSRGETARIGIAGLVASGAHIAAT